MSTKTIQIRISDSLFDAVADASAKDRRTKGNFIINVLEQHPSVKDSLGKLQAHACISQATPSKVVNSDAAVSQFVGLGQPKTTIPSYDSNGEEVE